MRHTLALLSLLALAPATTAQSGPVVFTTLGPGVTTGTPGDPYDEVLLSAALGHSRAWGWRTLHAGVSVQAEPLGRDGYVGVHLGGGATASPGPFLLSASVGPSLAYGTRSCYSPGPVWPDGYQATVRLREREGLGVGVRATAQALAVVAPELGLGVEATHDQNSLLPTSGVRLLLSLGTHRRSLIR